MKGLELAKAFYREYGAPMLEEMFPHLLDKIAVGLCGSGSECFGYDDDVSQDHDFEPGFCIFIPDEDVIDSRGEFALEHAYSKLPKEFMGFKRSPLSPVGGNRHGVIRLFDFIKGKTGTPDGQLALSDWFSLPEQSLAEVTNGALFRDDSGVFTAIRSCLSYLPEDVRLKKLAGHLLLMGQAGQYNYERCISRGETGAAQLAVFEFVKSAIHAVFLLNKHYLPYYKWQFYVLRTLPLLSHLAEPLEYLISSGNDETEKKKETIEQVSAAIIKELQVQNLTEFKGAQMEGHAYSVNDTIENGELRNLHILFGV